MSASRFPWASARRCRLLAARHRAEHTSWRPWIGASRQMGHVREASTGSQQAHVRRPGSLRADFLTKTW
jgi:hypothetical protein